MLTLRKKKRFTWEFVNRLEKNIIFLSALVTEPVQMKLRESLDLWV
jgi:hypothetical protein